MNPYLPLRPLLFRLAPETAHELTLLALRLGVRGPAASLLRRRVPRHPVRVMGLEFPNRVGLAAGLDKNGECAAALAGLGFGFVEAGTVTPRPQPGNPRPRLFRLPEYEAIVNRMGFNSKGIDHLVERVRRYRGPAVLGINIGKNKDTPNERAVEDYCLCLEKAYPYAGYIAVNISSPNTPALRELQSEQALEPLLEALQNRRAQLARHHGRTVPLALKIAPDMDNAGLDVVAEQALRHRLDALIISNTTLSRPDVGDSGAATGSGGLSGRPLMALSTRVLKEMHERVGGRIPLIGSGGIMSADDALAKLDAGASLVQIYSGLIYKGPALIREIVSAMVDFEGGVKGEG